MRTPRIFFRSHDLSESGGRRRLLRVGSALVALFFLSTFVPPALFAPAPPARTAAISFEPVSLDRKAPGRDRLGPLRYLGGWRLSSDNPRFGGISAMHVEGSRVVALSDAGMLIRFPLPGRRATVAGIIDNLPDGPGSPSIKSDRDTESLAVASGRAWIGFERRNAIWRYELPGWRSDADQTPGAMRRWPRNAGAEGMIRLRDGRFLVFSEGAPSKAGTTEAVLFDGDPALPGTGALTMGYRAPGGYRLTDAAQLPDGQLLLLNRRFTLFGGLSAKLVLADLPPAEAGAVIEGEEIATFRSPIATDNMEALSVTQERGRTIVWLASDDNFNPIQRTLLLKFMFLPASAEGGVGARHAGGMP